MLQSPPHLLKLSLSIGVALIIGTSAYLTATQLGTAPRPAPRRPSTIELRAAWKAEVAHRGTAGATVEALRLASSADASMQHSIGHALGDALYDAEGMSALTRCAGNFLYGCNHQVIARWISEHGASSIPAFLDTCPRDPEGGASTGCTHGIGHGLIGFFDYSETGLTQALDHCPTETDRSVLFGCLQGAFMEYDLRKMGPEGTPRPLVAPLRDTCASLKKAFRVPCYFTHALWFVEESRTATSSDEALFADAGIQCASIASSTRAQAACFGGLGYAAAATSKYQSTQVAQLCAGVSHDPRDVSLCRACAVRTLDHVGVHGTEALLCTHADGTPDILCRKTQCTNHEFESI